MLARLDAAGLKPEPEADRYRLIRRLSLDLIGLPPTLEEVDEFVSDDRPDAYERLVDRLLARQRTASIGRGNGSTWPATPTRPATKRIATRTIWPFRDWVINALNADMPFDEFTIEQLAGDLLPNATQEQIIATAFHRNTMQNDEGGTDDEEYRVAAVIDRVNTTMQVWMGTTMGCCQCHTHKYDPFSHREYYELFAFFNQTADADRYDQEPLLLDADRASSGSLKAELRSATGRGEARTSSRWSNSLDDAQREWERSVVAEVDWQLLRPSEGGFAGRRRHATILDDGSVLVTGQKSDTDTYTVAAARELSQITAVRLEALPHDSLPDGGPGRCRGRRLCRYPRCELFQEPIRPAENVKYVRVELPTGTITSRCRRCRFSAATRTWPARGKATQSSTAYEGHARAGDRRQHASTLRHGPVDLAHGVQRQSVVGGRPCASRRAWTASCCGTRTRIRIG